MTAPLLANLSDDINGPLVIAPHVFQDERGTLVKNFFASERLGLFFSRGVTEAYYTVSQKNVLRGLHFQRAPQEIEKIIQVISGAILDVVVDLRPSSPTFKSIASLRLDGHSKKSIYIPQGFAHGYLCLEPDTCVHYIQAGAYDPTHEAGVHFASIGFDWGVAQPLVSSKDSQLPRLDALTWNF